MIYDITPRQWEYMNMYYGQRMTMEEIGQRCGVNKATVSRTLQRGRERLSLSFAPGGTTSFDILGIVKGGGRV